MFLSFVFFFLGGLCKTKANYRHKVNVWIIPPPKKNPIFGAFLGKNSILAYISLKIGILRSAMFENVIVTSYVGRFSKYWYQYKGGTLPYTMVPHTHTLGLSIKFIGWYPPTSGRCVTGNTLGRRVLSRNRWFMKKVLILTTNSFICIERF